MAKALDGPHRRAERVLYKVCGSTRTVNGLAALPVGPAAFSLTSIAALFALFTLQGRLPWSTGHEGMPWRLARTASASPPTPAGELRGRVHHRSPPAVMAGLGVQAFASAAVGICRALALIPGLVARDTAQLAATSGST
ncbi:hypothetical protein E4K10_05790 [Streptomyces sp. T1317-0309]|nr:hypothetical protein E4K10_05790 [Streptomyces sp. T1317-0309]